MVLSIINKTTLLVDTNVMRIKKIRRIFSICDDKTNAGRFLIKPSLANNVILNLLKISENQSFSGFARGFKMTRLARNGSKEYF